MKSRTNDQGAAPPADSSGFTLISNEKLLQLYTTMLKCRMLEARASAFISHGRRAAAEFASAGHEASVAAVAIDLETEDIIAPSHRDPALDLIQGKPLKAIFRRLRASAARSNDTVRGVRASARTAGKQLRTAAGRKAGSPLKVTGPESILAAQLEIVTRAALDNKKRKNGKIAAVFLGHGSASCDAVPRAIDLARLRQLPILFVFENDLTLQSASLALRAKAEDGAAPARALPWITVDGNDVVAVYRVATEAIAQARKGNGPTLIECIPYPLRRSAGAGRVKSRKAGQVGLTDSLDPVPGMEDYLTRKGLFSPAFKREVAAAFNNELDAAAKLLGLPSR